MTLFFITLQCVGFTLALVLGSLGYGGSAFWDLSHLRPIFNGAILTSLLMPFAICLMIFRLEFLKEIFKKEK